MNAFTRVRTIAFLLRVVAISAILSGVTFYFPERDIDSFLVWCGLPEMPHAVLMRYVLRGAGHLQVGIGAAIWFLARDPLRYQPVVIAVLVVFLIAAPAFYLTDAIAGLPCCIGMQCLHCSSFRNASVSASGFSLIRPPASSARYSRAREMAI